MFQKRLPMFVPTKQKMNVKLESKFEALCWVIGRNA